MGNTSEVKANKNWFFKFFPLLGVPGVFLLHNLNFYGTLFFTGDVYRLTVAYFVLPVAIYFCLKIVSKKPKERCLLAALLLAIFFFFFGAVQDFLLQYPITRVIGKTYVLPSLFLAPMIFVMARKRIHPVWLRGLTWVILFFFLSECALLLWSLPDFNQVPALRNKRAFNYTKTESRHLINIHHIVFDGYTNAATLKSVFNYQNPLDSFLLKEGFYIAGKTKSNYNFTPYSLASTLNMHYLQLNEKQLVRDYKNYLLGAKVYQHNAVFRFFKNEQYNVSHYAVLDNDQHLDKLGTFVPKTPQYSMRYQTLERIVMNPWLWHKAFAAPEETIPPSIKKSLRYYVQYNKGAMDHALSSISAPQYRFTHFLLPHEPYAFSKSSIDSLALLDLMDHKHGYIKQVAYANSQIIKLVTALKKNPRNVIIIQGDHGFRSYDSFRHSPYTQNETLNTFYFPDGNYSLLYDSISPVNTYPVLLNKFFHQNLPLLKDSAFIPLE